MTILGRDVVEVDALVTDRYLDSLLAGADGSMAGVDVVAARGWGTLAGLFAGGRTADRDRLDRGVRLASERLTRDLPRFHPSFRFEERLAVRLAEAAAAMRLPASGADNETTLIPFPMPEPYDPSGHADPEPGEDWADSLSRPLLVGGAVVASALSLAGAAWVAWHRSRVRVNPMARATRAVRATRAAHANRAAHAMRSRPV